MKIIQSSLYDLNIAEIPFCYLSKRAPKSGLEKILINYSDHINYLGQSVHRDISVVSTAIENIDKLKELNKIGKFNLDNVHLGFGGYLTLDLVYELHQLWFEQGMVDSIIGIESYSQLIERLMLKKSGTAYKLIYLHLEMLHGILVKSKNFIFRGCNEPLVSMSFYLFPILNRADSYKESLKGRIEIGIDKNYYDNIKRNALMYIPFNRYFFYSLKPLEKRIALYLSKIFNPRRKKYQDFSVWNRNLYQFAKQMPLISTDKKIISQTIRRALNGLIEKQYPFLERYEIRDGTIKFICEQPVAFENTIDVNKFVDQSHTLEKLRKKPDYVIDNIKDDLMTTLGDEYSEKYYKNIAHKLDEDLIRQCLSESVQEGKEPKIYFKHLIKKYMP